jgi:hypothetical protein
MTGIERLSFHMDTSAYTGVPVKELLAKTGELIKRVIPLVTGTATSATEANVMLALIYLLHVGCMSQEDDGNGSIMPEARHLLEVAAALLIDWQDIME